MNDVMTYLVIDGNKDLVVRFWVEVQWVLEVSILHGHLNSLFLLDGLCFSISSRLHEFGIYHSFIVTVLTIFIL